MNSPGILPSSYREVISIFRTELNQNSLNDMVKLNEIKSSQNISSHFQSVTSLGVNLAMSGVID